MSAVLTPHQAALAGRPQPSFAITTDLPVVPSDSPLIPKPGPDFLAEVHRMLPEIDTSDWAEQIEAWLAASREGRKIPAGLDTAAWKRQAKSKAEKQVGYAKAKAEKLLSDSAEKARSGEVHRHMTALYRRALHEPGFTLPVAWKKGLDPLEATFVPGGRLDNTQWSRPGPAPCRVLVVGKHPGAEEARQGLNFVGPASAPWHKAVEELGLAREAGSWYATNLVKFPPVGPDSERLPVSWIADCLPLLRAELMIARPDFVLCLGSDAAKALTGGPFSVTSARGEVRDLAIPAWEGKPEKTARMMAILHPAAAFHDPEKYDDFRDSLAEFASLVEGGPPRVARIKSRKHVVVFKERELAAIVDDIVARPGEAAIAMDCEWHGEWYEPGSWLRTIQFSPRGGEAYCVALRHAGGKPAFKPSIAAALPHLKRLCKSTPGRKVRVGGHYFRADLPWLIQYGLDVREEFDFDTAYQLHSVFETGRPFELETYAVKLLGVHRYDRPIDEAIKRICEEKGIKKSDLGGYGNIEDGVLHPYALLDADVTSELRELLEGVPGRPGLLDEDKLGLNSRRPERISQGASLAFLEMEMRGLLVEKPRIDALSMSFATARNGLLTKLRDLIGWPEFNPDSAPQVRELLFGEAHDWAGRRLRPPGDEAITLDLEPIKSTGKRGRAWEKIVEWNEEDIYSPAADKETLGMLQSAHPAVKMLRDVRYLGQILKNPLNLPMVDEAGKLLKGPDGLNLYAGGIAKYIASDGRVHPRVYPIETGRCSMSKPNLQNFSSQREEDYQRLLGDQYLYSARSIFRASPGHVIVKVDVTSAELWVAAQLSGDPKMIDMIARAMLPEDHPDFVDPHASRAVTCFKLDCAPNRNALKAAGHKSKRTAAKNQLYGKQYGRGDEALVRQCQSEGADISLAEMQALSRAYDEDYPLVVAYMGRAKRRAEDPGWIMNPYGRLRRFAWSDDRKIQGDLERQAMNFPIQSTVADAISLAMDNLYRYRRSIGDDDAFRFLLQVHDELDFEVPVSNLAWFVDVVVPLCLVERVAVPICDLDGRPIPGRAPFRFGTGKPNVYVNWGEKIPPELGASMGIPERFLHAAD